MFFNNFFVKNDAVLKARILENAERTRTQRIYIPVKPNSTTNNLKPKPLRVVKKYKGNKTISQLNQTQKFGEDNQTKNFFFEKSIPQPQYVSDETKFNQDFSEKKEQFPTQKFEENEQFLKRSSNTNQQKDEFITNKQDDESVTSKQEDESILSGNNTYKLTENNFGTSLSIKQKISVNRNNLTAKTKAKISQRLDNLNEKENGNDKITNNQLSQEFNLEIEPTETAKKVKIDQTAPRKKGKIEQTSPPEKKGSNEVISLDFRALGSNNSKDYTPGASLKKSPDYTPGISVRNFRWSMEYALPLVAKIIRFFRPAHEY